MRSGYILKIHEESMIKSQLHNQALPYISCIPFSRRVSQMFHEKLLILKLTVRRMMRQANNCGREFLSPARPLKMKSPRECVTKLVNHASFAAGIYLVTSSCAIYSRGTGKLKESFPSARSKFG